MYSEPHFTLWPDDQLRERSELIEIPSFQKPIKLGSFAVQRIGNEYSAVDNPQRFYLKYTKENFNQQNVLDLNMQNDEKLDIVDEVLNDMYEWKLDAFLKKILENKDRYLFKSRSYQPNTGLNDKSTFKHFGSYSRSKGSNARRLNTRYENLADFHDETNSVYTHRKFDILTNQMQKIKIDNETKNVQLNETNKIKVENKSDQMNKFIKTEDSNQAKSNEQINKSEEIKSNEKASSSNDDWRSYKKILYADFVALRSTFQELLICQYSNSNFTIYAEMFENTIYLQMEKNLSKVDNFVSHTHSIKKFKKFCTKRFDESSTASNNNSNANTSGDKKDEFELNHNPVLCFIFQSKIEKHALLYSASMNCFEDCENLDKVPLHSNEIKSVELKTCKKSDYSLYTKIRSKIRKIKYWAHSFLSNNQKIVVAFFDDDYKCDVGEIDEYTLNDLCYKAGWSRKICLNQFKNILSFIKRCFRQKDAVMLKFVHEENSKKIICQQSEKQVVPNYYKEELLKSKPN